jgi:HTH-type transcriptional regulator/antitoxin HigA
MSKAATRRQPVRDDYLALIRAFPLRAIRSELELETAVAVLTRLMLGDGKTRAPGGNDYLSALSVLVRDYEGKRYPLRQRPPLARLRHLLDESGTTPTDLRSILGCSQALVSLILAGKRELQKDHIRRLADFFRMEPGYFL